MKENLLLLSDALEKIIFLNTRLQYQKTFILKKLDDIVSKCNNTYHSTIKIEQVDIKSSTYIDYSKEIKHKIQKLKNW